MTKKLLVKAMYFDTETKQPELVLEDGTRRVIYLMPTGNWWAEYWMTPEDKKTLEDDIKERDRRMHEIALAKNKEEAENPKKKWKLFSW